MAVSALKVQGLQSFYQRHEPEKTVLYKVVADNWKTFVADTEREPENRGLPKYIKKEFEAYLKCGILQYGFLRVQCESCKDERLVAFSCKKRGFCPSCGGRRMSETAAKLSDYVIPHVPVRQWVLSVPIPMRYWLSSNPWLVTSVLEIIMRTLNRFYRVRAKAAGISKSQTGAITFIQRFGSALNLNVHFHILFLDGVFDKPSNDEIPRFHPTDSPLDEDIRKLGIHPLEARSTGYKSASIGGFSLHGGVLVEAEDRQKLEHLIRYVARPAIALERLNRTHDGNLIYKLKRTFTDGTTHVLFSPMEFLEKLVSLIPRPKVHLVRYHGVLAPHAKARSKVIPKVPAESIESIEENHGSKSKRISWARLLKRVFEIDISTCAVCRGKVKVIAAILEQNVIRKILDSLKLPAEPPRIFPARAPPQGSLSFGDAF